MTIELLRIDNDPYIGWREHPKFLVHIEVDGQVFRREIAYRRGTNGGEAAYFAEEIGRAFVYLAEQIRRYNPQD